MCKQKLISNKFDLKPDNNAFFILVYSDFYEIPLPALRFEKVEETDTIKVKNDDTEEKQRLFQNRPNVKEAKGKRRSKEKQIHS